MRAKLELLLDVYNILNILEYLIYIADVGT